MTNASPERQTFWQRIFKRSASNPSKSQHKPGYFRRRAALRDGVAVVFLTIICFLAIFQKMEMLAITSMVFIGAVMFKERIVMFLTTSLELLGRAKIAKVGDLELTVEQNNKNYSELLTQQEEWVRVIISELTSEQIGTLIAIHKSGKTNARDKNLLRILRGRGLLLHNAPSMAESTEVWLSELGNEIASRLTKKEDTIQNKVESEQNAG